MRAFLCAKVGRIATAILSTCHTNIDFYHIIGQVCRRRRLCLPLLSEKLKIVCRHASETLDPFAAPISDCGQKDSLSLRSDKAKIGRIIG